MKTGLTLGSGAARGLTHIGVLKALDDFDIKIIAVNLRAFFPHKTVFNDQDKNIRRADASLTSNLSLNEKIQHFVKHPLRIIGNSSADQKHNLPGFGKILYQMFAIVQIQMAHLTLKMAQPDIVIEPDTTKYSLFDFMKGRELIEIGYQAAMESLNDYPSENN